MKALFVHGLGSDKNSTTGSYIKQILKAHNCEVLTETFDLLKPDETIRKINVLTDSVDMLIGTSLGAFYVLACDRNIERIVLNPCMFPSIEIPKLQTVSEGTLSAWKQLEKTVYEPVDEKKGILTFGAFADNDELFSYRDFFVKNYGHVENGLSNFCSGCGKHKLTYEELVPFLNAALRYFQKN